MNGEFVRGKNLILPRSGVRETNDPVSFGGASFEGEIVCAADTTHVIWIIILHIFLSNRECAIDEIFILVGAPLVASRGVASDGQTDGSVHIHEETCTLEDAFLEHV